ncbi:MAG: hypothetical protein N2C14_27360 [Planctomycetales bacterium]
MSAEKNGKASKNSRKQTSRRKPKAGGASQANSLVGKWKYGVKDVAKEFLKLGLDDETAGRVLMGHDQHRQAIYFFVQAMDK